ncbi:putative damage-inducible protein DinB [Aquimarina sp. EL_43]|uniref:DinB family protein n=1 Tax=unclassified Aquimarina TaxID=2627091 RepID=UPI0018CB46F8|nr:MULTISPECIES: DinB family protein [unclassified Aquimarina]MBG6129391.1 putative damage-inducible protein DinB [Aquimarina sp. EL_35]MBG6150456.1 putative damage-inducible protein DinB [Aquimarina sp. EL_32]MBG6168236.1 putative damage-inducible protein DinB [Aquimarina sp. EL_43]
MKREKWFDRKFDFSFEENIFPLLLKRLEGAPSVLANTIDSLTKEQLIHKRNRKWSIQENIGHLIDLEPIWQGRLNDITTDKIELRPADLQNQKTDFAQHNLRDSNDLLKEFLAIRTITVNQLHQLTEKEIYKHALHPRLKTPMRTMDLFLFVAEHDDHHIAAIEELKKEF